MTTHEELSKANRSIAGILYRRGAGVLTGRNDAASQQTLDYQIKLGRDAVTQLCNDSDLPDSEFEKRYGKAIERFWTLERRALGM